MKDLPGQEKHPLLCFHADHQEQRGEQSGEGQDLPNEIFTVEYLTHLKKYLPSWEWNMLNLFFKYFDTLFVALKLCIFRLSNSMFYISNEMFYTFTAFQ